MNKSGKGYHLYLARIRCLQDCIECIRDSKALPEALCYVPASLEYKSTVSNARLSVFAEPQKSSKKLAEIVCTKGTTRIRASGEETCNAQGQWIKLTKESKEAFLNGVESDEAWILLYDNKINIEEASVLTLVGTSSQSANAASLYGQKLKLLNNWEEVVENGYALWAKQGGGGGAGRPANVSPEDRRAVKTMRVPPPNWSLVQDEELARFLVEHVEIDNEQLGSVKQFVESVDVSSCCDEDNAATALTDGNPETFWESDGTQGQHWIRLKMKKGTVIKKMLITIDTEDENYAPNHVIVMGGHIDSLKKLSDIHIDMTGKGDVSILGEQTEHHPFIEIRIKECRDDGIDTRIHMIKIKSTKERDLGLSRDIFTSEELVRFPKLEHIDFDVLYRRSLLILRVVWLLDSVIELLVPAWEYSVGSFNFLQVIRQFLPLLRKRESLINTFLKDSETSKQASVPKLYLNRRTASEHKVDPALDPTAKNALFTQVYEWLKKSSKPLDYRWSPRHDQWWECKFISEGIIDQGGGFRDSLADISDELCPTDSECRVPLPFFIRSPNQLQDSSNVNRDTYIPNPSCSEFSKYEWIGQLMGACLRCKEHLVLALPAFVWKQLVGESVSWTRDYVTVDAAEVRLVESIEGMDQLTFEASFEGELYYSTVLSGQTQVALRENGDTLSVSYQHRLEYTRLVKHARLTENRLQVEALRKGLLKVVPQAVLDLLTWQELEKKVSGDPEISVDALKKTTFYEDIEQTDTRVKYLWEALSSFTNEDRSRFLRFVTGRRRLPAQLYVCPDKRLDVDALPESSTCSSTLYLPNYSSPKMAEEKLRYAAYNCIAIDTDVSPWDE